MDFSVSLLRATREAAKSLTKKRSYVRVLYPGVNSVLQQALGPDKPRQGWSLEGRAADSLEQHT